MDDTLGPFGRAFVGDSPTKGTQVLLAPFVGGFLAGLWRLFHPDYSFFAMLLVEIILLGIIVSIFVFSNRYIEAHFNKKIGHFSASLSTSSDDAGAITKGGILSAIGITESTYLIPRIRVATSQIWDLSGDSDLRELFESDKIGYPEKSEFGASEKLWVSWLIMIFFTLLWWIVSILISYGFYLILSLLGMSWGLAFSISGILTYFIVVPMTALFIHLDGSLSATREMLRIGSAKRAVFLLIAIPLLVTIIDLIINVAYGILWISLFGEPSSNTDIGTYWDSGIIDISFTILYVAIFTPIAEELMFRGYLLDAIKRKHSDWVAIIISSILFGLVHIDPYTIGVATIGGIIYGWLRIRTRSLLPCIACHMMWNLMATMLTYL